jgi:hypothetical protein
MAGKWPRLLNAQGDGGKRVRVQGRGWVSGRGTGGAGGSNPSNAQHIERKYKIPVCAVSHFTVMDRGLRVPGIAEQVIWKGKPMSDHRDKDRTGLFTVVGAPYVAERHGDTHGHYHKASDEYGTGTNVAGLWLTFYALIIGVAVLGKAGAGSAIEVACKYLK